MAGVLDAQVPLHHRLGQIPDRRQDGVMKRWRGTPLPPWTYLSGFVGAGLIIAVAGFALIVGIGFAFIA